MGEVGVLITSRSVVCVLPDIGGITPRQSALSSLEEAKLTEITSRRRITASACAQVGIHSGENGCAER